jgi:hypothetical protein
VSFGDWDWDELREIQSEERFECMRFTLYFDGELPSSKGESKQPAKHAIREKLHWQLLQLFRDHISLPKPVSGDWAEWASWKWPDLKIDQQYDIGLGWKEGARWKESQATVAVGNLHFLPLVRASLDLVCELDVLFLRPGTPGLMERSEKGETRYDIDNRLLTLFDGLTVPTEGQRAYAIEHNTLDPNSPIFCLLGDDDRITAVNVRTDRLLAKAEDAKPDHIRLIIGVTLRAIRAGMHNLTLAE